MAQVKVEIDGVPYYGTVDGPDDLAGAVLQLRDVLRDHGAPLSAQLKKTLENAYAVAMGDALGKAVRGGK